jgi:hypothetical protein
MAFLFRINWTAAKSALVGTPTSLHLKDIVASICVPLHEEVWLIWI